MSSNLISKQRFNKSQIARYVVAFILSILLHVFLITGTSWQWPQKITEGNPIEIQLVPVRNVEPVENKKEPPAVVAKKQPQNVTPLVTEPELPDATQSPIQETVQETGVQAAQPSDGSHTPENAGDTQQLSDHSADTSESVAGHAEEVEQNQPAQSNMANLINKASYLQMDYDVYRGEGGMKIGLARVEFRTDGTGRYSLDSVTEAKGIAALIVSGELKQTSEGLVTNEGLRPESFSYQFGGDERKLQHAQFDWATALLTQKTSKETAIVPLPAGTQDILSFMFQFMFVPPLQETELHITNGKKLNHYSYGFEGEETITSKLGNIRTWHISRTGQEEAKDDLWLALDKLTTDQEYLPIKIRKTEKDGSVIEQIVTRISTDITHEHH